MPKLRNHYQVLAQAKACALLKTSADPRFISSDSANQSFQGDDTCVMHDRALFYINQTEKKCTKIKEDSDGFSELFTIMSELEGEKLILASPRVLEIMTFATDHTLSRNATIDDIRNAYKVLALRHHPDKPGGDQEKFKAVNEAHSVLSDQDQRKIYDLSLIRPDYPISNNTKRDAHFFNEHTEKKNYLDPNKDFTKDKDASSWYARRAELFSPKTLSFSMSRFLSKNDAPLSNIISSRTQKSFIKHHNERNERQGKRERSFLIRLMRNIEGNDPFSFGEELKKYRVNSQKAYRDTRQINLALYQPLRGLENLFLATVFFILFFILLLLTMLRLILYPFIPSNGPGPSFKYISELVSTCVNNLGTLLFLGLFQLVGTPLTWFIHIPLRSLNTCINGWEAAEDGFHMQRIVNEADCAILQGDKPAIIAAIALLHKKFQKAIIDKQYCRLTDHTLESTYYEVVDKDFVLGTLNAKSTIPVTEEQKTHLTAYLGLFKSPGAVGRQPKQPPCGLNIIP